MNKKQRPLLEPHKFLANGGFRSFFRLLLIQRLCLPAKSAGYWQGNDLKWTEHLQFLVVGVKDVVRVQNIIFVFTLIGFALSVFQQKPATSFQITKIYNERKKVSKTTYKSLTIGKLNNSSRWSKLLIIFSIQKPRCSLCWREICYGRNEESKTCETVILQECGCHISKKKELK